MKNIFRKSALGFFVLTLLSSCATMRTVQISYQVDENQPVKSAAYQVGTKDSLSSKVVFNSNPKQTLMGLITGSNVKKAHGSADLELYGELAEQAKWSHKENKKYDENFSSTKKANYVWDGYVIWRDMKANSRVTFKTKKKEGKYNFTIDIMDCGKITMKSLVEYGTKTGVVPLKIFTSTDGTEIFDVFMTADKNFVAFGADSNNPKLVEKYTPKTSTRELLNMKDQLIQVVDSNGNVVAQVIGDRYTLFIPESDPRALTVMQTVGLLSTYIGIVQTMD